MKKLEPIYMAKLLEAVLAYKQKEISLEELKLEIEIIYKMSPEEIGLLREKILK